MRVEATPINPSDQGLLLGAGEIGWEKNAGADPCDVRYWQTQTFRLSFGVQK